MSIPMPWGAPSAADVAGPPSPSWALRPSPATVVMAAVAWSRRRTRFSGGSEMNRSPWPSKVSAPGACSWAEAAGPPSPADPGPLPPATVRSRPSSEIRRTRSPSLKYRLPAASAARPPTAPRVLWAGILLVTVAGAAWAWVRQLRYLDPESTEPPMPARTERITLFILSNSHSSHASLATTHVAAAPKPSITPWIGYNSAGVVGQF